MLTSLKDQRVVVTGGAGFIGSHLVEKLLEIGAHVTIIDDLSTGSRENLATYDDQVELIIGDICQEQNLEPIDQADVIFHLAVRNVRASLNKPNENFQVNANGTLTLLERMRKARSNGRFIYLSSSEVYGIPAEKAYSERTLPAPTTVYGAGKLAGELITLAYHRTYSMDATVIRPFNNFGPRSHFEGDSGEVIPKFILRALDNKPLIIHGDGNQTRDFMFVRDTAEWVTSLASSPGFTGKTLNIGSGREIKIIDLAHKIISLTQSKSQVLMSEARPGDLPQLCADISQAKQEFNFSLQTSFEEGLLKTIDYFRERDIASLLKSESEQPWKI